MKPSLKHPPVGHFEVEPQTPRTLVERAYLSLRHDVICGKLAPGERLRVEHLKDQYEVGAGTLREALSLLVSAAKVNWLTTNKPPFTSVTLRFILPASS